MRKSFLTNAINRGNREQRTVLKFVSRKIVILLIPNAPAGNVDALVVQHPDCHGGHNFVAFHAEVLDSVAHNLRTELMING